MHFSLATTALVERADSGRSIIAGGHHQAARRPRSPGFASDLAVTPRAHRQLGLKRGQVYARQGVGLLDAVRLLLTLTINSSLLLCLTLPHQTLSCISWGLGRLRRMPSPHLPDYCSSERFYFLLGSNERHFPWLSRNF